MVHIVSHDSKARGKHLVQGNLLLHMHTAASEDTLQHTYTVSNSKKCDTIKGLHQSNTSYLF